jgi:hypothetical protein
VIAKIFSAKGSLIIPPAPLEKMGGTTRNLRGKSPFETGDLAGFKNLQGERSYGKRYGFKEQKRN